MDVDALIREYERSPNSCATRLQEAVWREVAAALPRLVREVGNGRPLQPADLEDLGHDLFLDLMERIDRGPPIGNFRNYACRAAKNAICDVFRRRRHTQALGDAEPPERRLSLQPEWSAITKEFRARLGRAALGFVDAFLSTYDAHPRRKTRVNISAAVALEAKAAGRSKPLSRYHFLRSLRGALHDGGIDTQGILALEKHVGMRLG